MKRFVVRIRPSGGRCFTGEQAAELVEAALVLSILLSLLIGIVWIGRAYNIYETVTRAVQEGARFAVSPSCASCGNNFPTDAEVRAVINGVLLASALDPASVNPPISIQRNQVLNPRDPRNRWVFGVSVSFGYPVRLVIPFTRVNRIQFTIRTKAQMRQEF